VQGASAESHVARIERSEIRVAGARLARHGGGETPPLRAVIPAKFSGSALALSENASREPATPVSPVWHGRDHPSAVIPAKFSDSALALCRKREPGRSKASCA
jgi:hypothetical protein